MPQWTSPKQSGQFCRRNPLWPPAAHRGRRCGGGAAEGLLCSCAGHPPPQQKADGMDTMKAAVYAACVLDGKEVGEDEVAVSVR